jgi:hypothetical protein
MLSRFYDKLILLASLAIAGGIAAPNRLTSKSGLLE